jgi:hypothetical protein
VDQPVVAEPAPHTVEPIAAPMTDEPISTPMTDEPIAAPTTDEPISVPLTDEPISTGAGSPAETVRGITTDDLPVFEPTDEEVERECPELAAARKLHSMLVARYGTGVANGGSGTCPAPPPATGAASPGSGPNSQSPTPSSRSDTDEPISAPMTDEPISVPMTDEPISEANPSREEAEGFVQERGETARPCEQSYGSRPAGPDRRGLTARGHPGGPAP